MAERVLLLGGTLEARALASRLAARPDCETIYSLAAATRSPAAVPVETRSGGFGGPEGLAAFLEARSITALIDATHPYAAQMSLHASIACTRCGVPRVVLARAPWTAGPDDRWTPVADAAEAARRFPGFGQRGFLSFGSRGLDSFVTTERGWFLVRTVEPPPSPLPPERFELLLARGPFDVAGERALLKRYEIDCVVSKNSGGEAIRAKIDAARELGLPVLMIDRPGAVAGRSVATPHGALAWLDAGCPP